MTNPNSSKFIPTNLQVEAIEEGKMTPLELEGVSIILTRWEETIYAFSGRCPHASAPLIEGELYKARIDCPNHQWRFDIRTGQVLWPPDEVRRLKRYEVLTKDGELYIRL